MACGRFTLPTQPEMGFFSPAGHYQEAAAVSHSDVREH